MADWRRLPISAGLPEIDISLVTVRRFLFSPPSRREIADGLGDPEQLEEFFELLGDSLRSQSAADPEDMINELAFIAELPVVRASDLRHGILRVHFWAQLRRVLYKIFRAMSVEARIAKAIALCGADLALPVSTELIDLFATQHGRISGQSDAGDELVAEEQLQPLILSWVKSAESAFLEGGGLDLNVAGRALILLRKLDIESFRRVVAGSLERPQALDSFLRAVGSGSWDSRGGRYVRFRESFLFEMGDPEKLRKVARTRLADSCLGADLRAICRSILSGEKEYFDEFG